MWLHAQNETWTKTPREIEKQSKNLQNKKLIQKVIYGYEPFIFEMGFIAVKELMD